MVRPLALATVTLLASTLVVGCGPKNRKKPKGGGDWAAMKGGGGSDGAGVVGGEVGASGKLQLSTTGAASQLQRITFDPVDEEHPSLSPDGSTLLVGLRTWNKADGSRYPGIVAVNPNGGGRTLMTQAGIEADRASWLPDGSSFVYATSAPGSWSIVRAQNKFPGAPYTVVANGDVAPGADYPSVAPDGLVALTIERNNASFVATCRLDGSGFELVEQGRQPVFSPDGKRIAFVREVNGSNQLFVSHRSGAGVQQLTFGKANVLWPSWSPDGGWIVVSTNRGTEFLSENAQRSQVWALRPDGSGMTQLTAGTADCGFTHWGADGFVYFNSNQAGNYDIWRLRPNADLAGKSI